MSFDAGSLQTFAMASSAASAITGAAGSIATGNANAEAAQYQAAVARNNQVVAEQNAKFATDAGRRQEAAMRERTAQMIGQQRAQMAANGIDIGSGSALRLQEDTAAVGELDALTIRNNAARAAYGYGVQASDFGSNSTMLGRQARNAETAGGIGAISSIVGGAGSVSDKWLRFKQPNRNAQFATDAASMWDVDMGV